ncbi:MAG: hypothetical protein AAF581_19120 [Planctomycetota bacterium]
MSQPFNIRDVIQQSTSDVTISELAKKGFKKVKVLHKDTVNNLVREAVDRVVANRVDEGSLEEKEELVREARAEFDRLAKEHQKQESTMDGLRSRVAELEGESNALREQLKNRYAEIARLQEENRAATAAPAPTNSSADVGAAVRAAIQEMQAQSQQPASEIGELKQVIEMLASKLSTGGSVGGGGSGGGSAGGGQVDSRTLENLFSHFDDISVESNLDKVQAKSDKAGGVSNSLNKLKSLKGDD